MKLKCLRTLTSAAVVASVLLACTAKISQRYWEQADLYLRQGQHELAINELQRVVAAKEDDLTVLRAQQQIALIYKEYLRDYQNSVRHYREVYKNSTDMDLRLQSRLSIARIYKENLGNAQIASEEYQGIFNEFGTRGRQGPVVLLEWAESLNDAGLGERASGVYGQFLELYPGHDETPRILIRQGQSLINAQNSQAARAHFEKIIELYTNNPDKAEVLSEAYFGLGMAHELKDDIDNAIDAYQKAQKNYPNSQVIEIKIERLSARKKMRRQ